MKSLTLGNGAVESFDYNSRLQLKSIDLAKTGTVLQHYDYKYGVFDPNTSSLDETKNNGQIARIEGTIGTQKLWQQNFTYDSIGGLSSAREFRGDNPDPSGQSYLINYDYDLFGNRYQKQARNGGNPFTQIWTEDSAINQATNRYVSGTNVTYDDAGNVTVDSKFRNLQFQYDANNRQKQSANLDVSPKIKPKFSDVGGDLARYKKERDEHLPEVIYYTDEEAGLTLMVYPNGYVGSFFYGPAAKDNNLRCAEHPSDQSDGRIDYYGSKFDEFVTNSAIDDVKARLDGFYDKGLKTTPNSTAYVILYRGKCRTSRYTLRVVKNYLMLRRLPAHRIKLLYGGYRDEPTMELWIVPKGASWPKPTPTYRSKGRWRC